MLWTMIIPVGCLIIVQKLDKEESIVPSGEEWLKILGVGVLAGVVLRDLNIHIGQNVWEAMLLDILTGCLLFAGITDIYIGKAYHFIWWLGMAAGVLAFWLKGRQMPPSYFAVLSVSIAAFVLLQQIFFARFYGRADCHAFCVCAFAEGSFGMGMMAFLVHMVLAFGLLAIVQRLRHNIGKYGYLKREVPFLPYITASFFIIIVIATRIV